MSGMIHIDGSQGEGGGQILRSSLALSMALGKPFSISRIRANRSKPGLMRQHLTAVEAAAAISSARVTGAVPGSSTLTFEPGAGALRGGAHRFRVGTAGSTTLVLQAILPALLFADGPSDIVVEGGTHALWAPPYEFFERALVPLLNRFGAQVQVTLERHGFYPAGGGRLRVRVEPVMLPKAIVLEHRGEIIARRAGVVLSRLPYTIAERELDRLRERLGWELDRTCVSCVDDALSPGNSVWIAVESGHATEVFSAIGEAGRSGESVVDEAIDLWRAYMAADVAIGEYLADQLMVPMAIAAARGAGACGFRTLPLSRHAMTNSGVIQAFVGAVPQIETIDGGVRWTIDAGRM